MTFGELKKVLKSIEEETQSNWDDAILFFERHDSKNFHPIGFNETAFQNAPFRAILFKKLTDGTSSKAL
jgi:hypothetical protein